MRISWNWLSELVDLRGLKNEAALAELLTQRGLEVESIERMDQGLERVVSAQILERSPHPQADRLSLCRVSVGSAEPLEIVCGAQNMKAGDKVALAQVGAQLPNGVHISQSKIRGVLSSGMLCSEQELGLKESSEGILILPPETPSGKPLADILGRNDVLYSLKITANRGDCLSHWGIAREIAAGLNQPIKTLKKPQGKELAFSNCPVSVELDAGDNASQFLGCWIKDIQVGPSPQWMVKRLEVLGIRSINNVVDASNWVMLELGHPTHAYDGDRIVGKKIHVRMSNPGESLPLLDGTTVILRGDELVIADQQRAIGLAGVMGGGNSEVQNSTKNVFLECAEFSPALVRKAAKDFQRKTEAAYRFERGVDPAGLSFVLSRLVQLLTELAGGQVVGAVQVQVPHREKNPPREVSFGKYFIHDYLGLPRDVEPLTLNQLKDDLQILDCDVQLQGERWKVCPPSYRLDLSIPVDFAEEVARSIGYDKIPSTLPTLSSSPVFSSSSSSADAVIDRAKQSLVKSGLNETLNFSFTSRSWLEKFQMSSAAKILNPLSEEYEVLVPSLIPGLVRNAIDNWNHHFGSEPLAVRLFELRPVFSVPSVVGAQGQMQTGVEEFWKLALALTGPRYAEGLRGERGEVDFFDMKAVIDSLLTELGARGVRYQPLSASRVSGDVSSALFKFFSLSRLFHPGQSVEVLAGNSVAGYFGLLHPVIARELKTRAPLWIGELDWKTLTQFSRKASEGPVFKPWPQFPAIERDFALVVKEDVSVDKICQLGLKAGKPLAQVAKVFDIYRGPQVAKGMTSVAVRVIFYDTGRSLQELEAESASSRILEAWKKELGAELRG